SCSPQCNQGAPCGASSDCGSRVCTDGLCRAPACSPSCANASPCNNNGDCASFICTANRCAPSNCSPHCTAGAPCGANGDGAGGMGEVYRAADLELGGEVAVKILNSVNAADVIRLKAEFRALANIVHPNLVDLHELFISDKTAFFTMEVVNGVELVDYLSGD